MEEGGDNTDSAQEGIQEEVMAGEAASSDSDGGGDVDEEVEEALLDGNEESGSDGEFDEDVGVGGGDMNPQLLLPALGNPLRAGLGLLLGLGRHDTVEDDSSSGDEDQNEERERFDSELPGLHSYLGEGREVRGRRDLDDEVSLPLLPQPGLSLIPGQLLPLHLFHPSLVSMMHSVIASPTKIFGVVNLRSDTVGWAGVIGTTAEVFEVRESESVEVGSPPGRQEVGLKLKARGRQRFRLVSVRKQADGNLVGQVNILPEVVLGDPLWNVRLQSQDRLHRPHCLPKQEGDLQEKKRKGSFSFLNCLRSEKETESKEIQTAGTRNRYRQGMSRWMSPHPPWVWDLYDPVCLVSRIQAELGKLKIFSLNMAARLPEDPTELSWWVAANLPLGDSLRAQLLGVDCAVQRLRLELGFLEQCRVLVCRRCGRQLGDQAQIFSMSKEGPQGAFVNPGGHVHETLTLHRAKNLRLVGRPSTEYSWFPGYAWTVVECNGCWNHIGWKFTASSPRLAPDKFYGFSRKSIETRVEVPAKEVQESDDDVM